MLCIFTYNTPYTYVLIQHFAPEVAIYVITKYSIKDKGVIHCSERSDIFKQWAVKFSLVGWEGLPSIVNTHIGLGRQYRIILFC